MSAKGTVPRGPRVVITGVGLITSLGLSTDETWANVKAGRSGMGPMPALESRPASGDKPGGNGGQAPELRPDWMPGRPREVRYLRRAIEEAIRQAGLGLEGWPIAPARCGCVLGTTLHGMRQGGDYLRTGDFAPLCSFLASHAMADALRGLPIAGLTTTTCSACSSGLGAVALAATLLRTDELDLVIAGGYDPVSEYAYAGFDSMRLVASGQLRPFCRDREGMKLAEGYAVVVLERAPGRGRSLAEIRGIGESADAHHLTQPHPDGEGALRAIEEALGNLDRSEIGLISAHATATPNNDASEYAAFTRAFGDRLAEIPAVAFKSHVGHTLGAAGGTELILSLMAMREGVAPPTANVTREDLEFPGIGILEEARTSAIRATVGTSLGFGGANTCVVLAATGEQDKGGAARGAPMTHGSLLREVFVTGVGFLAPGMVGNEALAARLRTDGPVERSLTGMLAESDYAHLINARRVRRMSEYSKLTLAATALACTNAGISDVPAFAAECSAILGSTHGGAMFCRDYYTQIVREGMGAANPVLFAEGVPNAASAQLSLMLGIKGACQTIIGSRTAGLDALRLAALRIASGQWERAIVSAAEEDADVLTAAYRHAGLSASSSDEPAARAFVDQNGFHTSCGAVSLILESEGSTKGRRALAGIGTGSAASGDGREGHAARFACVLADLGDLSQVVCSANGTWIDREEATGLAASARRRGVPSMHVSTLSGFTNEMFSVGPLAAVAGVLLTRKLPRLVQANPAALRPFATGEREVAADRFAVVASDYSGGVSGVEVRLM
jgi:3-oxoacyl-[acyl-carrier-protein] synthase II